MIRTAPSAARDTTISRSYGAAAAEFRVLASGSTGNCSVLVHGRGPLRRATLIDCGLSVRRTHRLLASMGLDMSHVDEVLLTHLDTDHFYEAWARALPPHVRLFVHERHALRGPIGGVPRDRLRVFSEAFALRSGAGVIPTLFEHDALGVVAYRLDLGGCSLGFATDLGRVTSRLIEAMAGVDALAIESNYCPIMQLASDRPEHLKRRIMGGAGHLSNEECAEAVRAIAPKKHVILIHLSRECNTPERAARFHAGAPYSLSVSRHDEPTPAIVLGG